MASRTGDDDLTNPAFGDICSSDALPFYGKYTDILSMDDFPEDERRAVAREVADKLIAKLQQERALSAIAN